MTASNRTLAAIVFTDIVGYSALVHRDDANALKLVNEHFALVRELAGRFGGKVIKTIGDSVHLEFASAQAATMFAIATQQRHHRRNAGVAETQRFDIRIGIHLGDVDHSGGDVYGDGVNIAARLQPLAPIGGIAISGDVHRQLREALRNRFSPLGPQALKNISTPVEVLVLEAEGAGTIAAEPDPAGAGRTFSMRATLVAVAVVAVALIGLTVSRIRGTTSPAGGHEEKSIAVLPFVDLSQAKDQEYFSDGVAEDVLNLLAKVPELRVIARTSSFSYKGTQTPITEIARALQVASVLQGSVRRAGDQVRISVQLVHAGDSTQLWSETYDRQVDDIFKIQDEIAAAVVGELKVRLLGAVRATEPVDPKVYPLILQAQALANQGSAAGNTQAITLYQQVVAASPDEARAWAGMARAYYNRGLGGQVAENMRLAKDAAIKALELDPGNPLALTIFGSVASEFERDLATAARSYERALELDPGNLSAINAAAVLLMLTGRFDEALPLYEYRVRHDPASPTAYSNLGSCLYLMRRWDAAIDAYRTTSRLSPNYAGARALVGFAILQSTRDAAVALQEIEAEPDDLMRMLAMPLALDALNRKAEADTAIQAFIDKYGHDTPTLVAVPYGYRGDVDQAFEWLERGAGSQDLSASLAMTEPLLDGLHDDPRWLPYLRKIGYAPEQLAKIALEVRLPVRSSSEPQAAVMR